MNIFFQTQRHMHHFRLAICNDQGEFGSADFHLAGDDINLTDITIQEKYRRQGFGTQLLQEVLKQAYVSAAKRTILEVRSKNLAALNLYKKAGFVQNGLRKKYYLNDSDDAVLMELFLPERQMTGLIN